MFLSPQTAKEVWKLHWQSLEKTIFNSSWIFYLTSGKMHSQPQGLTKMQGIAYKMAIQLFIWASVEFLLFPGVFFVTQYPQNNLKRVRCSNPTRTKEQVGLRMPWAHQKVGGFSCSCSWQLQPEWCWLWAILLYFPLSISNEAELAQNPSHCFHSITNACLLVVLALVTPGFMEGSNENEIIHSIETGKVRVIEGGQNQ